MAVPIFASPGRQDFHPRLSLSYDSGAGNGPFGLGWSLSVPSVVRKTAKGLPLYKDAEDTDTFILSGGEDLVPMLLEQGDDWEEELLPREEEGVRYQARRYRPRTEGLFARIERWQNEESGDVHWRSISKDNVTSVYGQSPDARIADPDDPTRVFQWLLEESYDPKGNIIRYEYKQENTEDIEASLPQEKNRHRQGPHLANRYVKRIKYGNRTPFQGGDWCFELVFDYGEHDEETPRVEEEQPWSGRLDPFSTYRAGFEIRTYRLCQRVLMFHHFDELHDGPCLVRSTDFTYEPQPHLTRLVSVTQTGYLLQPETSTYARKAPPPVEMTYTRARIDETVRYLDPEGEENLPVGVDGRRYQWVDLDGEGLSGILTQQAEAWWYKRSLGNGRFLPAERVDLMPSPARLQGGTQQLMDLAGDGQVDLVQLDGALPGFYERDGDSGWKSFSAFETLPNVDWQDPNLRLVDLTGDGHADILVTEDHLFTYYPSQAEKGFGPPEVMLKALDEEEGPALVFADAEQSVYLADLSGDGLTDIVRIRSGEVCYWPNLGYGRFGAKVTMDQAPPFEAPGLFDPRRLRLADIDGSGTTDLIYLGREAVRLYFNQSGNSWSAPRELASFAGVDDAASVQVTDLLGNGTACLVWSSPLPAEAARPLAYIDLMGGQKPHLIASVRNNMGRETRVEYAPSTKFYLADRAAGRPWITKLPFPVHVVERTETREHVTGAKFVSLYKYHHGYFDGEEREFRGFGQVEQWDTEHYAAFQERGLFETAADTVEEGLHRPPTHTKTWFHTGAYLGRQRIARHFEEDEYYTGDPQASLLLDTTLPSDLTPEEARQACRVLRGRMLRQEVYALDEGPESTDPYQVVENAYRLRMLQPVRSEQQAVFYAYRSASITYAYERNPGDPRVSHQLALQVDDFGNVTQSATVAYPRRPGGASPADVPSEQQERKIRYTETDVINKPDEAGFYRVGVPSETRTYEVTKAPKPAAAVYEAGKLRAAIRSAAELPFEAEPAGEDPQKRLISRRRIRYSKEDATGPLPFGEVASHALPFETYRVAFTPGLLSDLYGSRVTSALLESAGYVQEDGVWWVPSGRQTFDPDQFYRPVQHIDPFGAVYTTVYDDHALLIEETRDAFPDDPNIVRVKNNYRVLQPEQLTDPNDNRSAVHFDALGMVVATAAMGKGSETKGDTLEGFQEVEPSSVAEAIGDPHRFLQNATTRILVDLDRFRAGGGPVCTHTISRETHAADLGDGEKAKVRHSIAYLDGRGREAATKAQAEPGEAHALDEDGHLITVNTAPELRWVGTGRTVFDNKDKPVKQYEPFFSTTHEYEDELALTEWGVSVVMRYDPLGRLIRTDAPDGTFSKVEFDPWQQASWDASDTVRESDWWAERQDPAADPRERRTATLAEAHAGTPSVAHLDVLGRPFLRVEDNGSSGQYETHTKLDIKGTPRVVTDAKDRPVMTYRYDLLGRTLYTESMDTGERWMLPDAAGNPVQQWDSREHRIETRHDVLRRPVEVWMQEVDSTPVLIEKTVYGEAHPDARAHNLRGRVYQQFDGAGVVTFEGYDFKGNLLRSHRQFAEMYDRTVDWSAAPALEAPSFAKETTYDALNRPQEVRMPDTSRIRLAYNEASLLDGVEAHLRGADPATVFVQNIDYNARGQRTRIAYGNGVSTRYTYDANTFRLARLRTTRSTDGKTLQDLRYTYDPVGNITEITDDAQQEVFFRNQVASPHARYEYDALYRLTWAEGREQARSLEAPQPADDDLPHANLPHPNDAQALHRYEETYDYDAVGNLLKMAHRMLGQADPGRNWTRHYQYEAASNRLRSTSLPGDASRPEDNPGGMYSARYAHDVHGNMTAMPHLAQLTWDFKDQLREVDLGGGGTVYYVYDAAGQRVRKVHEHNGATVEERLYLGGFEVYRKRRNGSLERRRETLHLTDDARRIALVETKTHEADAAVNDLTPAQRYQLGNHLGSASLEVDENAQVITYEEYFPFGGASYRSGRSAAETSLKRYRYTGKERDGETGLYYYGARYYAAWLGRWTAADPIGLKGGINRYAYVRNNPVRLSDPAGTQDQDEVQPGFGIRGDFEGNISVGPLSSTGYCDELNPACGPLLQFDLTPEDRLQLQTYVIIGDPSADVSSASTGNEEPTTAPRPDSLTHAGPGVERGIWGRSPRDRGYTLEHLYNNDIRNAISAQGDNRPLYDVETDTHVKQVKTNAGTNASQLRSRSRTAIRDAAEAIDVNSTGTMTGKSPQGVIVTPTDAPSTAGAEIRAGYDYVMSNDANVNPNSVPPEHVRGLPGRVGSLGRGLTVGGAGLSAVALGSSIASEDYSMATGDVLSTVGGGLELYAIASPGATVAGVSAMSAGLATGGIGIAITSGISGYRSYQRGDYAGAAAGAVGVLAGAAITLGVIFGSPALVVGGLIAAAAVGLFHLGRWLF